MRHPGRNVMFLHNLSIPVEIKLDLDRIKRQFSFLFFSPLWKLIHRELPNQSFYTLMLSLNSNHFPPHKHTNLLALSLPDHSLKNTPVSSPFAPTSINVLFSFFILQSSLCGKCQNLLISNVQPLPQISDCFAAFSH